MALQQEEIGLQDMAQIHNIALQDEFLLQDMANIYNLALQQIDEIEKKKLL